MDTTGKRESCVAKMMTTVTCRVGLYLKGWISTKRYEMRRMGLPRQTPLYLLAQLIPKQRSKTKFMFPLKKTLPASKSPLV